MKLLLVTHFLPPHEGGIERIAEDHARAAAADGFDVAWVGSREPAASPADEACSWGRAVRVRSWNGFERRLGVPYPVWAPGARRTLAALVDWCDVVHAHDVLYPGTSLALAEAKRRGRPALLTQHVGFVPYRSAILRGIQRLAYATVGRRNAARATALAAYSEGAASWLRLACGYRGVEVYLPNAVDDELFRPARDEDERRALRERHRLPADRPVVLFAGRLVHKKGAHLVVAAAEPGYHTLLVGERGELAVPSRPGLELRPFVGRETFAELLRAADVFVLPSRGEGFPLVAQEAMASGLPVVLGADPAYARQLDAGAALLIEPAAEALRLAIRQLLGDTAARARMGTLARQSALRHWGVRACRERLLATYRTLGACAAGTAQAPSLHLE